MNVFRKQMVGNVVVFVCVNVVGALMHSLMETAQRRAFLDTRNCIAARLDMEDENEKLVKYYYYLPFCEEILMNTVCKKRRVMSDSYWLKPNRSFRSLNSEVWNTNKFARTPVSIMIGLNFLTAWQSSFILSRAICDQSCRRSSAYRAISAWAIRSYNIVNEFNLTRRRTS